MSTTPTTPGTFTGSSAYSSDLQQVLARSIAIASLPLDQLNNQLTTLQSRSSALDSLDGQFAAVLTAIQGISSAVNATTAQVSNSTVLSAQSDSTAAPGTYSIHIVTPGSSTSSLSSNTLPAVQDPSSQSITTSGSLTLTVGGTPFTITPSGNNLSALADAINASGANVSATIVNLGSPSAPSYQLSVQSTKLGNVAIQLNDGSQNLLTTLSSGTLAQYQVNGQPSTPISSDSSTVTLAPGVTAQLLQAGDSNVVVSQSSSAQADSLSAFTSAYNAAVDELASNRGQGTGALVGDSLVSNLAQSLRDVTGFSGGSGSVQNLTDLGLTFDSTGHLSFDQSVFNTVASAHPSDVSAFLGSPTTGGFLKLATDTLNGLEDPVNGTIETTRASAQTAITNQNQKIADEQARIDALTSSLTANIDAADALIAQLEQQATYFTSLFASMNGTSQNA
ncbi:MAG TPA: flagellar filament capping protein FliD [Bryobacteraceae bacterium]|jgi:flagellar hook-associated protein 2